MNLSMSLFCGIYAYGFEKPYAIQQWAILSCIKGYDVITQAQSETGKIVTFVVSILWQIELELKATQTLVLVPTRDLDQQMEKVVIGLPNGITWVPLAMAALRGWCACWGAKAADGSSPYHHTPDHVFDMLNWK